MGIGLGVTGLWGRGGGCRVGRVEAVRDGGAGVGVQARLWLGCVIEWAMVR